MARDRDEDRRIPWGLRLPSGMTEAIAALAKKTRRSKTEEVVIAIEKRLAEYGLWNHPVDSLEGDQCVSGKNPREDERSLPKKRSRRKPAATNDEQE